MHVGTSPDDDPGADVADHAGCEDGAVDERQDHGLGRRPTTHAQAALEVRRLVEKLVDSQVERRRRHVVDVTGWRHRPPDKLLVLVTAWNRCRVTSR